MAAVELSPKPVRPAARRVAWGVLLADAPWDGRPRAVAPLAIPATEAGLVPLAEPSRPAEGAPPRPKKRSPFGQLLASAPWAGRPVRAPLMTPDFPATLDLSGRPEERR